MTHNKLLLQFLLIAIIIKLIAIFYTKLDLFGDEAQYWIWSKNLAWGYYSKPPLLAWVVGLYTLLIGNSFISIKLIPISIYFFSSFLIYFLSFALFKKKDLAIISAGSFYLLPSVTISSFLLSTDVVLIFFWILSLIFLIRTRENPSKINIIITGLCVGLSFLAKYAAVYFLISFVIFILIDKKTLIVFLKNKINTLIFIFSISIVLLPNIFWNKRNDWITFSHTSDNANLGKLNINFIQGLEFLISQSIMLGPLLVIFFIIFYKKVKYNYQTKFLLSFSLPVFLIVLVESVLVRANANWAAVGIIPMFILMVSYVYKNSKSLLFYNNILNFCFCLIFFCLVAFMPNIKVFDRINGISEFSEILDKNYLKQKNYLVVDDRLIYSNLKYKFRDSNLIIYTPHKPNTKIMNHFDIVSPLDESFNKNFIFVGNINEINYLKNNKKIKLLNEINVLFTKLPIKIYEISF